MNLVFHISEDGSEIISSLPAILTLVSTQSCLKNFACCIALASATYSVSHVDNATVGCFLLFLDISTKEIYTLCDISGPSCES